MSKKHSILIISYTAPFPVTDGGKMSIYGTVNYLREYFDITLVFIIKSAEEAAGTEKLENLWPNVNLRPFLRYRHPGRMKRIKTQLKKYYGPVKKRIKDAFAKKKNENNPLFNPFEVIDRPYFDFIENVLKEKQFEIVQVEYTELLALVKILPASAKKIFVQIENRHLLLRDMFRTEKNNSDAANNIVENARLQEKTFMGSYDHVFALNRLDKQMMEEEMGLKNVFLAPYPIPDSLSKKHNIKSDFKAGKLLFIGSQAHYPNEDGVKWFIENMYTTIHQQTGLQLYVTGTWRKEFTKQYPNTIFTGFVEDLSGMVADSIVISPIRLGGGGVRAKIILAMDMGGAIVSTTLCSEGLEGLENGRNILLADTEPEFAAAIDRLVNERGLGGKMISSASELVEKYYSEKAVGEQRRKIYDEILHAN